MASKIYILATLVAATSAGYSQIPFASYPDQQMMYSNPYPMAADKTYSNYLMQGPNTYNSPGMYQSYMPMSGGMANSDVYSEYRKYPMMPMMPSGLNVRYTSTPTAGARDHMQEYGQMGNHYNMPSAAISYSNGGQMSYNQYQVDTSVAAPKYEGYAQSSMKTSVSSPMANYYGAGEGHGMMMNSGHHHSHHMPSSYAAFSGNGANYQY